VIAALEIRAARPLDGRCRNRRLFPEFRELTPPRENPPCSRRARDAQRLHTIASWAAAQRKSGVGILCETLAHRDVRRPGAPGARPGLSTLEGVTEVNFDSSVCSRLRTRFRLALALLATPGGFFPVVLFAPLQEIAPCSRGAWVKGCTHAGCAGSASRPATPENLHTSNGRAAAHGCGYALMPAVSGARTGSAACVQFATPRYNSPVIAGSTRNPLDGQTVSPGLRPDRGQRLSQSGRRLGGRHDESGRLRVLPGCACLQMAR
jgi:hypothetical protein